MSIVLFFHLCFLSNVFVFWVREFLDRVPIFWCVVCCCKTWIESPCLWVSIPFFWCDASNFWLGVLWCVEFGMFGLNVTDVDLAWSVCWVSQNGSSFQYVFQFFSRCRITRNNTLIFRLALQKMAKLFMISFLLCWHFKHIDFFLRLFKCARCCFGNSSR